MLSVDSELLDVDRVSYWSFRDDPPSLVAELGYVRSRRLFARGLVLLERDCANYVAEVRRAQVLAVDDARSDPRVHDLSSYLERYDIQALLDVPVFAQRKLVGLLCHEHVGSRREWSTHDLELALSVGQVLTNVLDGRARSHAEKAEERASFLDHVSTVLAGTLEPDRAQQLAVRMPIPILGEMAALVGCDGTRVWRVAQAHQEAEGERVLDQFASEYGADIGAPGLSFKALREGQSLLLPMTDPSSLRAYGLPERPIELLGRLGIRSAMSVPLHARGSLTGVLTFASTTNTYDRDDLRFAEAYAHKVGVLLSNIELYARAQDAIAARDEFLSLVAHELRTPLTSLALSAAVLAQETPPNTSVGAVRAVDAIVRQAKRLSRLLDLLFAASQPEAPMRIESVDVTALVREVIADLESALARASCELRLDADEPIMIDGDRDELRLVLSSLLENAMKFGAARPIDVSVEAQEGSARVVVRDHGIGISDEQHRQLFRRFGRGVSMRNFGGLGLGLHISSRIVEAHGGTLRAVSCPGNGATLTLELPRTASDVGAPSE